MKSFIKKRFQFFYYFYSNIGYRFLISLSLSLFVGLSDGFGLAMFMPLLEMTGKGNNANGEGLGKLSFLMEIFHSFNFEVTTISILILMLIFFVLKGILKYINTYYNVKVQRRITRKLQYRSIDLLSNFSYKEFVVSDIGKIQNTFSGEVDKLMQAYRSFFNAIQSCILVLSYFVMALIMDYRFALFVGIGGWLSNFLYKTIYVRTKKVSKEITLDLHSFSGQLMQMVLYFKYLKSTGLVSNYGLHLKKKVNEIQNGQQKLGKFEAILTSTKEPLILLIVVLVIILQIKFFNTGISQIVLSLLFFYRSLSYLMVLQTHWNNYLAVSGSMENMTEFVDLLASKQDTNGTIHFDNLKEGIKLENIDVMLGEKNVVNDFNYFIAKNKTIGIVGESGSGKTTIVNVLSGLIKPNQGKVKLDNVSIMDLEIKSYQNRIGYITQEPVIFSDSVFNNVTFWQEKSSNTETTFREALDKAAILDFVETLPSKEDTFLQSNGNNISGGQKQRISIARELYKELDILIMDEATSALDSENESIIQGNLQALKGKFTIVIVAHRLSTLKFADEIIVMDKGRIVAKGTFDELLTTNQVFRRMAAMQGINVEQFQV